jgi:hypothetical protein
VAFHVPNRYRRRRGPMASDDSYGNAGAFQLPSPIGDRVLIIIAGDGLGWEHVSIHAYNVKRKEAKTPTWEEMCHVKALFWDPEDWVVQYHPAESEYVNNHPHTLHLWRPTAATLPTPPSILVGVKDEGVLV